MKVRIDPTRCQGHIMCTLACSEIFALNEVDGHGYVLTEEVPPDLAENVSLAQRSCPEMAIEIDP